MQDDLSASLARWADAGVIDAETAERIRAFETSQPTSERLRWPIRIALAFGGVMICGGILLFVAADWEVLSPSMRFGLALLLVAVFHVGGASAADRFPTMAATLHAIGTVALGAGIALGGQIFNLEEHWPGGLMLWALGAGIGWTLLRQIPQMVLFATVAPLWLGGEWVVATDDVRDDVGWAVAIVGSLLLALAYLAAVGPGRASRERGALRTLGIVLTVASAGTLAMVTGTTQGHLTALEFSTSVEIVGWIVALGGPLALACLLRGRAVWPIAVAVLWAFGVLVVHDSGPWLFSYLWWALGAIALVAWGIDDARAERINLGAVAFAATILTFYFSEVMDKVGRSASLVGLGLLFLGGGWALERSRRRFVARARRAA